MLPFTQKDFSRKYPLLFCPLEHSWGKGRRLLYSMAFQVPTLVSSCTMCYSTLMAGLTELKCSSRGPFLENFTAFVFHRKPRIATKDCTCGDVGRLCQGLTIYNTPKIKVIMATYKSPNGWLDTKYPVINCLIMDPLDPGFYAKDAIYLLVVDIETF